MLVVYYPPNVVGPNNYVIVTYRIDQCELCNYLLMKHL